MSTVFALFGILGALLAGAMVPGPSFVLVSRIAARSSRADGLAAAIGMGLGGVAFATLALLGLVALLTQVQWLSDGLRVAGGLYLMHVGLRIWCGASRPLGAAEAEARRPSSLRR